MNEGQRIHDAYGEVIEDRADKVEKRMKAPGGQWGIGFMVARREDIEQRVYETLLTNGITLEDIQNSESPEGYLHNMCLNKGLDEAKKARAFAKNRLAFTGFVEDAEDGYGWVAKIVPTHETGPAEMLLSDEFDRELVARVRLLIGENITAQAQGRAVELWTLSGYTFKEIGEAMGTNYEAAKNAVGKGLRSLGVSERGALSAARTFFHPQAQQRPNSTETPDPKAVQALLMGVG